MPSDDWASESRKVGQMTSEVQGTVADHLVDNPRARQSSMTDVSYLWLLSWVARILHCLQTSCGGYLDDAASLRLRHLWSPH